LQLKVNFSINGWMTHLDCHGQVEGLAGVDYPSEEEAGCMHLQQQQHGHLGLA
jgi:hypothetical protein